MNSTPHPTPKPSTLAPKTQYPSPKSKAMTTYLNPKTKTLNPEPELELLPLLNQGATAAEGGCEAVLAVASFDPIPVPEKQKWVLRFRVQASRFRI